MNTFPLKSSSVPLFERRYRTRRGPVRDAAPFFEQDPLQIVEDSLLRDRYRVAFEPGCSTGALTARLATRCDRVIAQDVAAATVARAQRRCSTYQNVRISAGDIATQLPDQELDLIVFCEMGFYFSASQLRMVARRMAERMGENAEFVAVHWLGRNADHRLNADQVHAVLGDELPLLSVKRVRYPQFRLDTWVRA